MIRRRSAIEPAIGHMKVDGKPDRNWLKGALDDAMHAVLCGAGYNLRMILRRLRLFYALVLVALLGFKTATPSTAQFGQRDKTNCSGPTKDSHLLAASPEGRVRPVALPLWDAALTSAMPLLRPNHLSMAPEDKSGAGVREVGRFAQKGYRNTPRLPLELGCS